MTSDAFHIWLIGWLTAISLCIPALIIVIKQGIAAYAEIRELIITLEQGNHENASPAVPPADDSAPRH